MSAIPPGLVQGLAPWQGLHLGTSSSRPDDGASSTSSASSFSIPEFDIEDTDERTELPSHLRPLTSIPTLPARRCIELQRPDGTKFKVQWITCIKDRTEYGTAQGTTRKKDDPVDLSALRDRLPPEIWLHILDLALRAPRALRPRMLPRTSAQITNAMLINPIPFIGTTHRFFDTESGESLWKIKSRGATIYRLMGSQNVPPPKAAPKLMDVLERFSNLQLVSNGMRYDCVGLFYRVNTFEFRWAEATMLPFFDALAAPPLDPLADALRHETMKLGNLRHVRFWLPVKEPADLVPEMVAFGLRKPLSDTAYALAYLVRAVLGPDVCFGKVSPPPRLAIIVEDKEVARSLGWLKKELWRTCIVLEIHIGKLQGGINGRMDDHGNKTYIAAEWRYDFQPACRPFAVEDARPGRAEQANDQESICPDACRRRPHGILADNCGRGAGNGDAAHIKIPPITTMTPATLAQTTPTQFKLPFGINRVAQNAADKEEEVAKTSGSNVANTTGHQRNNSWPGPSPQIGIKYINPDKEKAEEIAKESMGNWGMSQIANMRFNVCDKDPSKNYISLAAEDTEHTRLEREKEHSRRVQLDALLGMTTRTEGEHIKEKLYDNIHAMLLNGPGPTIIDKANMWKTAEPGTASKSSNNVPAEGSSSSACKNGKAPEEGMRQLRFPLRKFLQNLYRSWDEKRMREEDAAKGGKGKARQAPPASTYKTAHERSLDLEKMKQEFQEQWGHLGLDN